MATRSSTRQRVKEILGFPDTSPSEESGSPSNDEINVMYDEARRAVRNEIARLYPERAAAADTTLSYTANSESASLPSATVGRRILAVYALPPTSSNAADKYRLDEIARIEFGNMGGKGSPSSCAIEGSLIYLRPIPTSTTTLYFSYVAGITATTDDSATNTDIPAEFHDIYAYKIAAIHKMLAGDPDADRMDRFYEMLLDSLLKHYESMVSDNGFRSTRSRRW